MLLKDQLLLYPSFRMGLWVGDGRGGGEVWKTKWPSRWHGNMETAISCVEWFPKFVWMKQNDGGAAAVRCGSQDHRWVPISPVTHIRGEQQHDTQSGCFLDWLVWADVKQFGRLHWSNSDYRYRIFLNICLRNVLHTASEGQPFFCHKA